MSTKKSGGGRDLKIIIVGDSGTGKTSLVNKYILNKFAQTYQATIASQFSYKIIKIDDVIYRIQFWDIAGQDRSPETTGMFCKNTNGVIICCEAKRIKTRENTLKWRESIENNIDINKIPVILIENKCDLYGNDISNYNEDIDELKKFCKENNFKNCFRTSALNGYGLEEAMNFLLREIIATLTEEVDDPNRNTVALSATSRNVIRNNNKKCC